MVAAFGLSFLLLSANLAFGQEATSTPDSSPAPAPEPDAPRITVEFEELNDSGVSGSATLFEAGDQTIVELELEDTGENHPAHIHLGTCDDIEPEAAFNLDNVTEEGASTTLVDVSLSELLDGDYLIDLHLSPNELGILIVCAEIEGQPANAEGTPVAVGGPGDPTAAATIEPVATESPIAVGDAGALAASAATLVAAEALTVAETSPSLPGQVDAVTDDGMVTEAATSPPLPGQVDAATEDVAVTAAETVEPAATQAQTVVPAEAPTQEPPSEQAATPEPTPTPDDSTDGTGGASRPIMSDGTGADSGKGSPLVSAPTPKTAPVGSTTSNLGDGTNGGSQSLSGKGAAVGATSALPESAGSGSSLISHESQRGMAMWLSGVCSIGLLMLAMFTRRRESQLSRSIHVSRRRRPGR